MMHDFCLTIPYGGLLFIGGLVGLLMSGSFSSAVTGCGIGAALVAIGWSSYQEYVENKDSKDKKFKSPTYAYVVVAFVLTLIVTFLMVGRYNETQKMMPAGYVSIISGMMVCFYVYKLMLSGDVGSHAERAYKRND